MKFLFTILMLCVALGGVIAQTESRCGTPYAPAYFINHQAQLEAEIAKRKADAAQGRTEDNIYVIPLVFHVIHKGEAVGQGTNISFAQIKSQVDVLNEDYRRGNADRTETVDMFKSVAADARIEFVLATEDPSGVPLAEAGVHRVFNARGIWSIDDFNSQVKPATGWNPERYFNIWVVDSLNMNGSGFIGYAQFPDLSGLSGLSPGAGAANTDGIVLDHNNVGSYLKAQVPQLVNSKNKLGRTLTHEMGHALGLLHTWGNSMLGSCSSDLDYCPDTPILYSSSSGCDVQRLTCGQRAMVQNYMDYSTDKCLNLFTRDQVARMRTVLEISPRRKGLVSIKTGLADSELSRSINIYPNPAQHLVRLEAGQVHLLGYALYNTLGQQLVSAKFENNDYAVDLQGLQAGVYFIKVETAKGLAVKRLVVEK